MQKDPEINVLGAALATCSQDPVRFFPRRALQHLRSGSRQPYRLRGDDGRVLGLFKIFWQ